MNRRILIARHAASLLVECWTLAEIGYYCTHDGETLHGKLADACRAFMERARHRAAVRETLDMIHDLPERKNQ